MSGGDLQVPAPPRLLPLPHLYPNLPNCHDVMDLILDQGLARTRTDLVRLPAARNYKRFSKIGKVSKGFVKKNQKNH